MLLAFWLGMTITIGGLKLGWAALRLPFEFTRIDLHLNCRVPTVTVAGWVRRCVIRVEDLTAGIRAPVRHRPGTGTSCG